MHPELRPEEVWRDRPRNFGCSVQPGVDRVLVAEVNRYRFILATDADQLAVEASLVPDGAERLPLRRATAREFDDPGAIGRLEMASGVVPAQQLVEVAERCADVRLRRSPAKAVEALAYPGSRRVIDSRDQRDRAGLKGHEVNTLRFSEKLRQGADVFPQPRHRQGLRREALVDQEPVFFAHQGHLCDASDSRSAPESREGNRRRRRAADWRSAGFGHRM